MSENLVKCNNQVKTDGGLSPVAGVIKIDERQVQDHLGELVRQSVEETLNGLLDAEADELCGAKRYERTEARHASRELQTQVAYQGERSRTHRAATS